MKTDGATIVVAKLDIITIADAMLKYAHDANYKPLAVIVN